MCRFARAFPGALFLLAAGSQRGKKGQRWSPCDWNWNGSPARKRGNAAGDPLSLTRFPTGLQE